MFHIHQSRFWRKDTRLTHVIRHHTFRLKLYLFFFGLTFCTFYNTLCRQRSIQVTWAFNNIHDWKSCLKDACWKKDANGHFHVGLGTPSGRLRDAFRSARWHLNGRLTGTSGQPAVCRSLRTPAWRSTSAGSCPGRPGWSHRSRSRTFSPEAH